MSKKTTLHERAPDDAAREVILERWRNPCQPCEARGYFDSRHPGYRGHTTCSWCNGTGRASHSTGNKT